MKATHVTEVIPRADGGMIVARVGRRCATCGHVELNPDCGVCRSVEAMRIPEGDPSRGAKE